MSKRGADSQRLGNSEDFDITNSQMDGANKATAAQMANRRINRARGGRRPGIQPRPTATIGTPPGAQQGSTSPSFTFNHTNMPNGMQEQQSGFSFGQSSNGISQSFNQPPSINPPFTSQSFPPFGASGQNAFNPPSSVFNFSAVPNTINNPFSTSIASPSGSNSGGMGSSNGFQGSIFNIPPTTTFGSSPSNTNGSNSTAKVSDPARFKFGSTGESTNAQLQLGANTFDSITKNVFPSINTPSALEKPTQPITNIFGQLKSPTKLFGQNPPPSEQPRSQQPISNIFGQPITEQSLTSSSLFGSNMPSSQHSNTFTIQNEDNMSTSPDNSPQSKDTMNLTPFMFPNAVSQAKEGGVFNTQGPGGNIFNRISQPAAKTATLPPVEQGQSMMDRQDSPPQQNPTPSTTSHPPLFSLPQAPPGQEPRTPEMSPTKSNKPTFGELPFEQAQAVTSSLFGNIQVPPTTPTTQSTAQQTPPASHPFDRIHSANGAGYKAQGNSSTLLPMKQSSLEASVQRLPMIDFTSCVPPAAPAHFTEVQRRQLMIGWQLKYLDTGLQQHIATCPSFHAESEVVHKFYSRTKEDILNGHYVSEAAGSKTKLIDNLHEGEKQSKNARFEISSSNSSTHHEQPTNAGFFTTDSSAKPLLTKPAPVRSFTSTKRKAEESLVSNKVEGAVGSVKRARTEDRISHPSFSSSSSSQTSNMFMDILKNKDSDLLPSPIEVNPQNIDTSTEFRQEQWDSSNPSNAESSSRRNTTPAASGEVLRTPQISPISSSGPARQALLGSKPDPTLSQPVSSTSGNSVLSPAKQIISNNAPPFINQPTSFAPPAFGVPLNFLSQFGKAAEATAKKEKASRKAEDFDSDEDDAAEWDRKYAEEERTKRQKLDEELNGKIAKFVPGQGFSLSSENAINKSPKNSQPSEPVSHSIFSKQKDFGTSLLSNSSQKLVNGHNIFGHLSDAESGAEGSKTGDADDEDTGSEENDVPGDSEEAAKDTGTNELAFQPNSSVKNNLFGSELPPAKDVAEKSANETDQSQPTGGLFDRISRDANGNPIRELPPPNLSNTDKTLKLPPSHPTTNIFGQKDEATLNNFFDKPTSSTLSGSSFGQTSPFSGFPKSLAPAEASTLGQPPSGFSQPALLGTSNSPKGDNTWKVDSPIKFGSSESPPGVTITSPSPSKPELGGLFGSSQTNFPTESHTKSSSGLFSPTPTKDPSVSFGFGFGGPPKPEIGSLAPPTNLASNNTSRATSPGATTGGESANESNADEETVRHEQLDLTSRGPGEENEDVLFTVKAKAMSYDVENKTWPSKGVGMLRVLKHRETTKTRILMRQDPSGKITLNTALLSTMKYEYIQSKTVKIAVATDQGKLSTWMLRTGKDEDALELARILEAEKDK